MVENPNDPQSPWGPGDLLLPDRRLDEVSEAGFNFLCAVKNSDCCTLLGGVSAARPRQTPDISKNQAALEISLPYQQIASVVSAHLSEQIPQLRGQPVEQVQQRLLFGFASLFGIKEVSEMDAVQVGIGQHPDDAAKTIVQLRIAPTARASHRPDCTWTLRSNCDAVPTCHVSAPTTSRLIQMPQARPHPRPPV